MAPTIEHITESAELGEAPHWDVETQSLYYVDMIGMYIFKYTPSTKTLGKAYMGKRVSFIIPVEGSKDRFLISLERDLAVITWDGISPEVSKIEKIAQADPAIEGNAFNDGKTDATGRLWAGTMGSDFTIPDRKGTFYSFGKTRRLKSHFSNIHISNGLAFGSKKLYYIDSSDYRVDQFDYDEANEAISNRQTLFTLAKYNIEGMPDGQAIDTDGNLWVALFNGSKLIKIDGQKPETLLGTIDLPAKQITSVAFGGPNLDELYVTTAKLDMGGEKLSPPVHGAVYRITGLGVKGLPGVRARI